jgi:hypothetical protein
MVVGTLHLQVQGDISSVSARIPPTFHPWFGIFQHYGILSAAGGNFVVELLQIFDVIIPSPLVCSTTKPWRQLRRFSRNMASPNLVSRLSWFTRAATRWRTEVDGWRLKVDKRLFLLNYATRDLPHESCIVTHW